MSMAIEFRGSLKQSMLSLLNVFINQEKYLKTNKWKPMLSAIFEEDILFLGTEIRIFFASVRCCMNRCGW